MIGYIDSKYGIDAQYCSVLIAIHEQSEDIAQGINEGEGLYLVSHLFSEDGMWLAGTSGCLTPSPPKVFQRVAFEITV